MTLAEWMPTWRLVCCGYSLVRSPDASDFMPERDTLFNPRDPDSSHDPAMFSGIVHYEGACPACGTVHAAAEPSFRLVIRK